MPTLPCTSLDSPSMQPLPGASLPSGPLSGETLPPLASEPCPVAAPEPLPPRGYRNEPYQDEGSRRILELDPEETLTEEHRLVVDHPTQGTRSVPPSRVGGALLPQGATRGQVLRWNGTDWVPSDIIYTHVQDSPSAEVVIDHQRGAYPEVVVVGSDGEVGYPDVKFISLDKVQVTLSAPMSFRAYLYA